MEKHEVTSHKLIKYWSGYHWQSAFEACTIPKGSGEDCILILQDTGKPPEETEERSSLNISHQPLLDCESKFSAIKLFHLA